MNGIAFKPAKGSDGKPVQYSVPEIIDILNEALNKQNWAIIRTNQSIFVWPSGEKIPGKGMRIIQIEDLGEWGNSEWVSFFIVVKKVNCDKIAPELQKILGNSWEVVPLQKISQLWMSGQVGALKKALKVLECKEQVGEK